MIYATDVASDYSDLINHVQRHTKCSLQTCLRRKGDAISCRYKAPWTTEEKSELTLTDKAKPKHTAAHNDD